MNAEKHCYVIQSVVIKADTVIRFSGLYPL